MNWMSAAAMCRYLQLRHRLTTWTLSIYYFAKVYIMHIPHLTYQLNARYLTPLQFEPKQETTHTVQISNNRTLGNESFWDYL